VLALRADMTLPIARLVASRYASAEPPLRFCYLAHVYRAVRPHRGESREFLQGGVELIGQPAPSGTAEVLSVLCTALNAVGLETYRIGVGDASLFPALLEDLGVPHSVRGELLGALVARDFVTLERLVRELGLAAADAELLLRLPQRRGGAEILNEPAGPASAALGGLRRMREALPDPVAARLIFDLGLSRGPGYYTGAIFEVYDPALGVPLGGGGRYDDVLARFGRPLPAVGFALNVERLHMALLGEERGAGTARVAGLAPLAERADGL
jgi:ATP phosphoribosyltransferase regulatory subunit